MVKERACSEQGTEFVAACVEWSTKNNEPRASMTGLALNSEGKKGERKEKHDGGLVKSPVNDGTGKLVIGGGVVSIIRSIDSESQGLNR